MREAPTIDSVGQSVSRPARRRTLQKAGCAGHDERSGFATALSAGFWPLARYLRPKRFAMLYQLRLGRITASHLQLLRKFLGAGYLMRRNPCHAAAIVRNEIIAFCDAGHSIRDGGHSLIGPILHRHPGLCQYCSDIFSNLGLRQHAVHPIAPPGCIIRCHQQPCDAVHFPERPITQRAEILWPEGFAARILIIEDHHPPNFE